MRQSDELLKQSPLRTFSIGDDDDDGNDDGNDDEDDDGNDERERERERERGGEGNHSPRAQPLGKHRKTILKLTKKHPQEP